MIRKPYRLNVVGDFYVEKGCCTLCGVPEHYAPDLFAPLKGHEQCFVKRQPSTPVELDAMFEVMSIQELDCVRYRGMDKAVLSRMAAAKLTEYADLPNWRRRLAYRLSRLFRPHKSGF